MKALVVSKRNLEESNFLHGLQTSSIPTGVEKITDSVFTFDLEKSSNYFANLLNFLNERDVGYHLIYLPNDCVEFSTQSTSLETWTKV